MNRIDQLFNNRGDRKLLSLYFCAGCPTLDGTADVITTLQQRGIDMIEVGIPFSDPLADGPVIQEAATKALRNGMTLSLLFDQLRQVKEQVRIPLYAQNGMALDTRRWLNGLRKMLSAEPYNIAVQIISDGLGHATLVLGSK